MSRHCFGERKPVVIVDGDLSPFGAMGRGHVEGLIRGVDDAGGKAGGTSLQAVDSVGVTLRFAERFDALATHALGIDDPVARPTVPRDDDDVLGRLAAKGLGQQGIVAAELAVRVDASRNGWGCARPSRDRSGSAECADRPGTRCRMPCGDRNAGRRDRIAYQERIIA